jgi:hypothetical protein
MQGKAELAQQFSDFTWVLKSEPTFCSWKKCDGDRSPINQCCSSQFPNSENTGRPENYIICVLLERKNLAGSQGQLGLMQDYGRSGPR